MTQELKPIEEKTEKTVVITFKGSGFNMTEEVPRLAAAQIVAYIDSLKDQSFIPRFKP